MLLHVCVHHFQQIHGLLLDCTPDSARTVSVRLGTGCCVPQWHWQVLHIISTLCQQFKVCSPFPQRLCQEQHTRPTCPRLLCGMFRILKKHALRYSIHYPLSITMTSATAACIASFLYLFTYIHRPSLRNAILALLAFGSSPAGTPRR